MAEGWEPELELELGEWVLPPQAKAVDVQPNPFSSFSSLRAGAFPGSDH